MPAATPEQLAALVQDTHTAAVIAFEGEVAATAIGSVEEDFTRLQARTVAAWVAAFGAVDAAATGGPALRRILATVRAAVRRILQTLMPRAVAALNGSLPDALALGARQHADWLAAATGRHHRPFPVRASRRLRDTAAGLADVLGELRDRALVLLAAARVRRWSDVAAGIGAAQGATGATRRQIALTVGQAVNAAGERAVAAAGADKLWVAERDACVTCAAYAGLIAPADGSFPAGLSWDPRQRGRSDALATPPKHPWCRCRVVAWRSSWLPPGVASLPEALRREAERSIARGWSMSTESRAARLRAAAELLHSGSRLPRSVQRAAQDAVRAGHFPARTVPTG